MAKGRVSENKRDFWDYVDSGIELITQEQEDAINSYVDPEQVKLKDELSKADAAKAADDNKSRAKKKPGIKKGQPSSPQ